MKLSRIFYNPFLLLLLSACLSFITTYYFELDVLVHHFWQYHHLSQFISLTFVYYLFIYLINDSVLVLRRKVPWYFFLITPIFALCFIAGTISWETEFNTVMRVIFGLSITGFILMLIGLVMFFQINKTSKLIRNNLSDYFISEEPIFSHSLVQHKYSFKDFTATIIKLVNSETKKIEAEAVTSTIVKPTRSHAAAGTLVAAGTKLLGNQLRNSSGWLFEIYLNNTIKKKFSIHKLGTWSYGGKALGGGQFDDQKLRELAKEIDSEVEENISVAYFITYRQEEYPRLRLVINPDYFILEPIKVYNLISNLRKHVH